MFFKTETESKELLSVSIEDYLSEIKYGKNEGCLLAIEEENSAYTDKEKVGYIQELLKKLGFITSLNFSGKQLVNLIELVHLKAVLRIWAYQHNNEQWAKFKEIQDTEVEAQLQAGMPGPCLASFNAIDTSNLSIDKKLSRFGLVIIYFKNTDGFGSLKWIVLREAIERCKELSQERGGRDSQIEQLNQWLEKIPSIAEVTSTKTMVDELIEEVWSNLKEDMGVLITKEKTSSSAKLKD